MVYGTLVTLDITELYKPSEILGCIYSILVGLTAH